MKITTVSITILSILAGTGLALAQGSNGANPLFGLIGTARGAVGQLVPLLIGIAVVCFFYGLVMFIIKGKEGGEAMEKSKQFMIYSLVALFVMASLWGIVGFMQGTLGINPNDRVISPALP